MADLVVPKLNNNDEGCTVRKWLAKSGAAVKADDIVAVLEDSKATFDLPAGEDGTLAIVVAEGEYAAFGATIGRVATGADASLAPPDAVGGAAAPREPPATSGPTITKGALELMDKHGIARAEIVALGHKVVRASDVEALVAARAPADAPRAGTPLSRHQASVARTVKTSHATIPSAFLLTKVQADAALAHLRHVSERDGIIVGLPELLVKAIALLHPRFPAFFSALTDDEAHLVAAKDADVGVTLDLGKGLFIPVVRAAASRSVPEIARALMDLKLKAMRGDFKQADLAGGAITLSLAVDADVVASIPIIVPGQVCMIVLGAVASELVLADDGAVRSRSYVHLGYAYDHRVVNGFEATSFAMALKRIVESPERLV